VTVSGVRLACKDWGTIHEIKVPRNDAGRLRGFALVKVETPTIESPIPRNHEVTLEGRKLRIGEVSRVTWQIPPRIKPPTPQLQGAPLTPQVKEDDSSSQAALPASSPVPVASVDDLVYLNASFEDGLDRVLVIDVPRTLLLDVGTPRAGSLISSGQGVFSRESRSPHGEKLRFVVSSPLCRVTPTTAVYEVGGPSARFELVARHGSKDGSITVTISILRDDALVHVTRLLLIASEAAQQQVQP